MSIKSAITINRPPEEVAARITEAEPPVTDDTAEITFRPAPGGRGTEVRVALGKSVPGGALGEKVAAVIGVDPQRQLDDALRRFKQVLETGEVLRSDGSPGGTDARQQRTQRAAEPQPTDR